MTDEEFLKLAQECGALHDGARMLFFIEWELLTLCRTIERRALERAADAVRDMVIETPLRAAATALQAENTIRAMIEDKE